MLKNTSNTFNDSEEIVSTAVSNNLSIKKIKRDTKVPKTTQRGQTLLCLFVSCANVYPAVQKKLAG